MSSDAVPMPQWVKYTWEGPCAQVSDQYVSVPQKATRGILPDWKKRALAISLFDNTVSFNLLKLKNRAVILMYISASSNARYQRNIQFNAVLHYDNDMFHGIARPTRE